MGPPLFEALTSENRILSAMQLNIVTSLSIISTHTRANTVYLEADGPDSQAAQACQLGVDEVL